MQCKYCGKEYKNVILHEIRCKNNPNKLPPISQLRKVTSNQYIKAKELGLPKPQLTQEAKENVLIVLKVNTIQKKRNKK